MPSSIVRALIASVLVACAAGPGPAAAEPAATELLDGLAEVAARYRAEATHFTCEERIRLHTDVGRRDADYVYLYRVGDDGRVAEGRLRERTRSEPVFVDLGAEGFEAALLRPYSWVFLFEPARRDRFAITVEPSERVLGRQALRLRMEPLEPIEPGVNDWVATVWVERDSLLPLRVEARTPEYEAFWESYRRAVREGAEPAPYVIVEDVTTEFGVREGGMRFPSEATVTRWHYDLPTDREGRPRRRAFLIRQLYGDYRFYAVAARTDLDR